MRSPDPEIEKLIDKLRDGSRDHVSVCPYRLQDVPEAYVSLNGIEHLVKKITGDTSLAIMGKKVAFFSLFCYIAVAHGHRTDEVGKHIGRNRATVWYHYQAMHRHLKNLELIKEMVELIQKRLEEIPKPI